MNDIDKERFAELVREMEIDNRTPGEKVQPVTIRDPEQYRQEKWSNLIQRVIR